MSRVGVYCGVVYVAPGVAVIGNVNEDYELKLKVSKSYRRRAALLYVVTGPTSSLPLFYVR